jgi:hypothetical protein
VVKTFISFSAWRQELDWHDWGKILKGLISGKLSIKAKCLPAVREK